MCSFFVLACVRSCPAAQLTRGRCSVPPLSSGTAASRASTLACTACARSSMARWHLDGMGDAMGDRDGRHRDIVTYSK